MLVTKQFEIGESAKKLRLDDFLYGEICSLSRMFIRDLIERQRVFVNQTAKPGGYHVQPGDRVEISFEESAETAMTPQNLPLDIVFEDAEMLVVNKLPGMLVHPTKHHRTGTLANALVYHLNFRENESGEKPNSHSAANNRQFIRPGLIHRLDKETSGLLVVAKTHRAHRILSAHFGRKLIKKLYLALVAGRVDQDAGEIKTLIDRTEEKPHWRAAATGKLAETHFRVAERFADATLLELEPVTGRTNQLRIHCQHLGFPIIGDAIYNGREFSRLCLHAQKLAFFHPNGGWLEFETAPPDFSQHDVEETLKPER